MKRDFPRVYLMIFLTAIMIGFMIGSNLFLTANPKSLNLPFIAQSQPTSQRNILLVGADSLDSKNAELQSIWLLIYFTDKTEILLMPIFPDPTGHPGTEARLSQAFQLTPQGKPVASFWSYSLLASNVAMSGS